MKPLRNTQRKKELFSSENYTCWASVSGGSLTWTFSFPEKKENLVELPQVMATQEEFLERQTARLGEELGREREKGRDAEEEQARKLKFIREVAKTIIKQKCLKLKTLAKRVSPFLWSPLIRGLSEQVAKSEEEASILYYIIYYL